MLKIRASMLPSTLDCMRRAAANQYEGIIEDAGFTLNPKRKGVYTLVGSGVHAANKFMLIHQINTGERASVDDAIAVGIDEYNTKFKESENIIYDNITINQKYGEYQIKQLTKAYHRDIVPRLIFPENADPADYIERYIKTIINGYEFTGHVDLITKFSICDTKSGKLPRAYHSQLGGYGNLVISAGGQKPKYLLCHFLPRVHPDKPHPGTKIVRYDVDFSLNEAWYLVNQIIRDVNNFIACGNPASFQANPQSTLCNKKYCRAYDTEFCKYH